VLISHHNAKDWGEPDLGPKMSSSTSTDQQEMASVERRVLRTLACCPSSLSFNSRSEYLERSEVDRARALASSPPKTEATNSEAPCEEEMVSEGSPKRRQVLTSALSVRTR